MTMNTNSYVHASSPVGRKIRPGAAATPTIFVPGTGGAIAGVTGVVAGGSIQEQADTFGLQDYLAGNYFHYNLQDKTRSGTLKPARNASQGKEGQSRPASGWSWGKSHAGISMMLGAR